jgi:invasion protein IalB
MKLEDGVHVSFGDAANKDAQNVKLPFAACVKALCTAQADASSSTLQAMKAGGSMTVRAVYNENGKPYTMTVPLAGFATAHAGNPVDNQQYKKSRAEMFDGIAKRRGN